MQHIILDTDPGIDDALALFLTLASPEIEIEAITTVSGNIPVARGSSQPLVRQPIYAAHVHGRNGLGEVELPEPQIAAVAQHAVDLIIKKVTAAPAEITLVPIGPLTNIALAVCREPRIAQQVREVVIMGGALRVPGNDTPAAEFNIYADPDAAHIVLHAGWPIRLVSLDVTMLTLLQRQQVN